VQTVPSLKLLLLLSVQGTHILTNEGEEEEEVRVILGKLG
jgi:hypothetical protein